MASNYNSEALSVLGTASDVIAKLRQRCGKQVVDEFQFALGGIRIRFPHPQRLTNGSALVEKLGWAKAVAIAEAAYAAGFFRFEIEVPIGDSKGITLFRGDRRDRIEELSRQGFSCNQVALECGVCRRTVLRYRAKMRSDETPDVIIMLKRGMNLEEIAGNTILTERQIMALKQKLKASGELPLSRKSPSSVVNTKGT